MITDFEKLKSGCFFVREYPYIKNIFFSINVKVYFCGLELEDQKANLHPTSPPFSYFMTYLFFTCNLMTPQQRLWNNTLLKFKQIDFQKNANAKRFDKSLAIINM